MIGDKDKIFVRNKCEKEFGTVNYSKAQINAAIQALEDWWDDTQQQTTVSAEIDTATSPFVFTNAQKKKIAKFWLCNKGERE